MCGGTLLFYSHKFGNLPKRDCKIKNLVQMLASRVTNSIMFKCPGSKISRSWLPALWLCIKGQNTSNIQIPKWDWPTYLEYFRLSIHVVLSMLWLIPIVDTYWKSGLISSCFKQSIYMTTVPHCFILKGALYHLRSSFNRAQSNN